jgi:hypothetical protein
MSRRTVALPVPLALFGGIEIHAAVLTAVHAHSAGVVMATFCDPPVAGTGMVSGATAALQPLSCVIVNVWPPTVIVPVRAVDAFVPAANCTVPGPLPLAPDVMLIHPALTVAVHPQDCAVFTAKDPVPPAAGMVCPDDESEKLQPPLCVTVKV